MFVRDAKARCPHLLIVLYNFEAYEEVADQFYNILHKHCDKVQAVSCDEAFLDITGSDVTDPEILVSEIRKEILESTCCTASVGIGANMLMARLAIRNASEHFLSSLCKEVSLRLQGCGLQGRTYTLKIKKHRKDAREPAKYMGCGDCENLSHSMTVPIATDDVDILQRITMQLYGSFHIDVKDIRGIGLQVTKMESDDNMKQGHERNSMRLWLASGSTSSSKQCNLRDTSQSYLELVGPSVMRPIPSFHETRSNSPLPSLDDLDLGVIESLPPELFSEINDIYDN
ncbi:DNA repair protein REV1-like [Beta vulgaris subsp. vulgaris]|uniref:DNA repair protein REV1-like n=1 Tax=Beta vulgaris subsp. vulgaris TaxID=3555 RepID=UPI002546B87D|nr:DNA repair protein REV1-like [Beta vulgaris subsp. vulgaris]